VNDWQANFENPLNSGWAGFSFHGLLHVVALVFNVPHGRGSQENYCGICVKEYQV
jgi:hypothetical protein